MSIFKPQSIFTVVARIGLLCFCALFTIASAYGQADGFDPGWIANGQLFAKIGVLEDGMYRVTGAQLSSAGISINEIDPSTLKVFENGSEIPLWVETGTGSDFQSSDAVVFAGQRNKGDDEGWAFDGNTDLQGSTYYSLFSDTTWYWLTWGGDAGLRYGNADPNQTLNNPELYDTFRDTVHVEEDNLYHFGDSDDAGQPEYTRGEGYIGWSLSHLDTSPLSQNFPLDLPDRANTSDSLIVTAKLSSGSAPSHLVKLNLDVDGSVIACSTCEDEIEWSGYSFRILRIAIPQSLVAAGANFQAVVTSNNDFNSIPNRVLIDWVEASYQRNIVLSENQLNLSVASGDPRNIHVTASLPVTAFNILDQRRIDLTSDIPGVYRFNDDATAATKYWLVNNSAFLTPSIIKTRPTFNLAEPAGVYSYLIITTPALASSASEMAAYRQSAGGHNTLIVNQADIFDQFDYGRPTPLAIRRFIHETQTWSSPPEFVLFWGDLLRPEDHRARRALFNWEVISFGYAPADGWFGMQVNGPNDWAERPAIGRIPVRDNETGSFFVQKIANYETVPVGAWQKRMLLLVGGQSTFEQTRLQNHAESWGDHATGLPTGMDTLRFFKTASEPLDPTFQDALSEAFSDGASWVSYFGHSAADTWEIVTDAPEEYNNADRLPIVLSLGCNTGNFAGGRFELTDRLVYGERLVLASMNGAIAHWGSSSASTIEQPAQLTNALHKIVFQDTVRVLGKALAEAKKQYIESHPQTSSTYNVLLQYGLIGDPATHIRIADKPEFQTSPEAISVTPITPVPADGHLTVDTAIRNWGLLPVDSVNVQLTHVRPGGEEQSFFQKILPTQIEETLSFQVPIFNPDIGENTLRITLDADNQFEEVDELNNIAERAHTVFSAGLALLSPIDFGISASLKPDFKVSLATNDASAKTVAFEVDNVPTFNSPSLQSGQAQTMGAIAVWQLATPLPDDQSYFWRARIESGDQENVWQVGHFTVDGSATRAGWTQQSAFFAGNETDPFLNWNEGLSSWEFSEFKVDVRSTAERGAGFEKGQFIVNGTRFLGVTLGFGAIVIDGLTGELKKYDSFPTFQISEDLEERFDTDSTRAVSGLTEFLNTIETGDYLFVRTRHLGNLSGPTMQEEVKTLFRNVGSQAIDTLSYEHLWLMTTRKGFPSETVEWVTPPQLSDINEIAADTSLFFNKSEGYTLSPKIGPAKSWQAVRGLAEVFNTSSSVQVDVLDGDDLTVLVDYLLLPASSDLSAISAEDHPFVQLRATLTDSSQATTPQLNSWSVFFDPTVELAIDPVATQLSADTLAVAQTLDITASILNLSDEPADLATLTFTLTNALNEESVLKTDTIRTVTPGNVYQSSLSLETTNLAGSNRIQISLDQPGIVEPFTLNNVLIREFVVLSDEQEPTLEILIDNEMLPSDFEPVTNLQEPALPFVSSQPTIEITISDEGAFQLLNDTSLVELELDDQTIHFADPQVQFEPGTREKNEAKIYYTPDLAGRDTTHTLFLRVFDPAGNEADQSPYQVHFRVQSAFEIESLYPYPNPMHTATTFAFRLRGDQAALADDFRIRIYTLAGRLIKEFDLIEEPSSLEIPSLRIGWNKLPWDGRDEDGDLIAPGVYLYKVFLRADGQSLNVNNSSSVEKLVVLR